MYARTHARRFVYGRLYTPTEFLSTILAYRQAVAWEQHLQNKKHLKNVGPIRHSEPPHAALPFTRGRYCRVARRLRIGVHDDDDDDNDNA